ncbi:MAG TPA: alpha/beta hydrolase [Planctomycetes bacterium]|nr:alpha/beta hydrolase [Planctomycetota bacterium]
MNSWSSLSLPDGATLPFRLEGSGTPIVLIPGLGNSSRLFGTLPRTLARMGYEACVFDPPGLGRAGPARTPWSFEGAVRQLVLLLDHLGWRRCQLLGTSMGGKVALAFCAQLGGPHNVQVDKAWLFGTTALQTPRARAVYAFFDLVFRSFHGPDLGRALRPFLFGASFQKARPALVEDLSRNFTPSEEELRTTLAQIQAIQDTLLEPLLPRIQVPVDLHAGLEDSLVDPADIEECARLLPQGTYIPVPRAGHSMLLENPAGTLQRM